MAQTKTATTTTLTLTSAGNPVTSVASGTVTTLTATVQVAGAAVSPGQVAFCDASAAYCTDIHRVALAQLTSAGTATFKFRPGIGSHSYKAVFLGTNVNAGSSSSTASLTVTGLYPSFTTIQQSGSPGYYTLTATVAGVADRSSPPAPTGTVSFIDTTNANAVLATLSVGSGTASLGFLNSSNPATVTEPNFVAAADFNGDGILDLAVSNSNTGATDLTILLGNGDGTFTATPTSPTVGLYPDSIAVGDFNADGIPDLAISSVDDDKVTVLLGNGDGTFTAAPALNTVTTPQSVAVGDFNGDGVADLAVVNATSVLIFLGSGNGSFTIAPSSPAVSPSAITIAVADFNGDGIADLAVTYGGNSGLVAILLGNGDGTFKAGPGPLAAGSSSDGIVVADLNGDGVADLAATNYATAGVNVFIGNGDGSFQPAVFYSIPGINARSVVAADFNSDGVPDLAVGRFWNGGPVILPGKGDGSFGSAISSTASISLATGYIAAADFNGDGIPDLVEPSQDINGTAVVQLVRPGQTVSTAVSNINPVGPGPHQVEASYSGDSNYSASISGTTSLTSVVATPVFSLASGTYTSVQSITITDSTPGSTIYYQASGSIQTTGFVPYTGPIAVTTGGWEYITAYAMATGSQNSIYASVNFYLNLPVAPAPGFSVAAGAYSQAQQVTISDSVQGATIYYTTDGTYPTTSSAQYTGPVTISVSETLSAAALAPGYSISLPASAQYTITSSAASFIYTVAGTAGYGFSGDGGPATQALLSEPNATAIDSPGNLYIADTNNHVIREVAAGTGVITTFAGTGIAGYSGDGGPARSAQLQFPMSLAFDSNGNLFVGDSGNYVVRKIAAGTGTISTVAGNGTGSFSGDGGPATSASLGGIGGITVDAAGNLYISDLTNRVREVSAASGVIATVAGGGVYSGGSGYSGDGGPATSATLDYPRGLAVDAQSNLYIADSEDNVVRKVTASTQVISTFAGNGYGAGRGVGADTGDGGSATNAELGQPVGLAFDRSGNLYISGQTNGVIREVNAATNFITTVAGHLSVCSALSGDGGPAVDSSLCMPALISLDQTGNIYAPETQGRVRIITASALPPSAAAAAPVFNIGSGTYIGPQSITLTSTPGAAIYVTYDGTTPTTLSPMYRGPINVNGSVTLKAITVAPGTLPSQPAAAAFTITTPPPLIISTVAGIGYSGVPTQAGASALSTSFRGIWDVGVDLAGNFYFPDSGNEVVWKVSASTGTSTVFAGTLGQFGFSGDGGVATGARLNNPTAVALDNAGNLYIADTSNDRIRRVDATTGNISTFAGGGARTSSSGDGGPASSAFLNLPEGVTFDPAGNLLIADTYNWRIRKVSATTGIITTIAGTGTYGGPLGDGGPATSARLIDAAGIAADSQGNIYVADTGDYRVREIAAGTGIISTIAGNGNDGSSGDGLPAVQAEIDPIGLAVDGAGDIYISDTNAVVRELGAGSNVLTTVAGNGYYGYTGDGVSATLTSLCSPQKMAFDANGSLYIADFCNERIRKLTFSTTAAVPQFSVAPGTYTVGQSVVVTDATPGAVIYYTVDGSAPTVNSLMYSGPVQVDQSETLQAIAVAGGYATSPIAAAAYIVNLAKPVVTVTPSSSSIMTSDPLTVTVTVSGGSGNQAPTGSITVSSGTYSSAAVNLNNGSAIVAVPGGSLGAGNDTLTATYTPDASSAAEYASVSGSTVVMVTAPKSTPVVSVTPASSSITTIQGLSVAIMVTGTGTTPTGSVVLSSGTYQSAPASLSAAAATIAIPAGSLPAGTNTLTVSYTPDSSASTAYNAGTGSAIVTVTKAVPAIAISLSPAAITTDESLTVAIAVSGGPNNVPTGTVTLTSGSYTAQQALASGSATINISAGTLPTGTDTLSVTYTPDTASAAVYTSGTQTAIVTVSVPIGTTVATIGVTPPASAVTDQQTVTVGVTVSGSSGQPTPTGSTTLTAGSYSAQQTLSAGSASFQIPAGTLPVGTDTISIAYSGDPTYGAGSATTTITVSTVVMTASAPASVSPGSSATSTVKLLAGSGYSGTLSLTCALTSSPSGAQSLPTCGLNPSSLTITAGASATSSLTVQTTAASGRAMLRPAGELLRWLGTGGASLAVLFFFGIPARRRRWIATLVLILATFAFGAIGCGGGGGSQGSSSGSPSTPATTAGTYAFTVTAADSSSSKTAATATVTITVQ